MAEVAIRGLTKRYGGVTAVDAIDLDIADGEFLTLLGPSGCGKSTTLAAIAGLDRPDGGSIRVGERVFVDAGAGVFLRPELRNCGLVFQSYALWPHMTVFDNCAFPLKLRKVSAAERRKRVTDALALVEMERFADRYPNQLSGGQQQRVALARTLVYEPTILLLDEPLSNLDAKLRERARSWLSQLTQRVGLTTIYVTHDQLEALALSDRIAVMKDGRISQLATPQEIYERPADPFVADFIGTSNFLRGTAGAATGGGLAVALDAGPSLVVAANRSFAPGARVVLAVRPEKLALAPAGDRAGQGNVFEARIIERSYLGARYLYHLELGDTVLRVETAEAFAGPTLLVRMPPDAAVVFPGDTAP